MTALSERQRGFFDTAVATFVFVVALGPWSDLAATVGASAIHAVPQRIDLKPIAAEAPAFGLETAKPLDAPSQPRIGAPARVEPPPPLRTLEPLGLPILPAIPDMPRPPLAQDLAGAPPPTPTDGFATETSTSDENNGLRSGSRSDAENQSDPGIRDLVDADLAVPMSEASPDLPPPSSSPDDLAGRAAAALLDVDEPDESADSNAQEDVQVALGPSAPKPPSMPVAEFALISIPLQAGAVTLDEAALAEVVDKVVFAMQQDTSLRVALVSYATAGETSDLADSSLSARRISLGRALRLRTLLVDQGIRQTRIDLRPLGLNAPGGPVDRIDIIPLR